MFKELFETIDYAFHEALRCIKDMDALHSGMVKLLAILLCFFFLRGVWGEIRRREEALWSTLSGLFICMLLLCCVLADSRGTLVFKPSCTPEETVTHFLDSFSCGHPEEAADDLSAPRQLFTTPEGVDETSALYYQALQNSYSWELLGPAKTEETHASQRIAFTSLKLSTLTPLIEEYVMERLPVVIDERPKSEVFDEEENYRPEVLDEIYAEGVQKITDNAEDYYVTTELTLSLEYREGRWYILPDDELLLCFSGYSEDGDMFANNARADVLGQLTYIPKHYVIPEDMALVPAPNQNKYGMTDDPQQIKDLLAAYPRVTGIDEPFWHEDIKILDGQYNFYADETIVAVAWRELYMGKNCSFADVYIADPSQLRRKLVDDTYGSPIHKSATALAAEANAVIALNGDFYKFRGIGITAYRRQLYRFNPSRLELCHMDASGNMHFTYSGELETKEDAEKYIADNDIIFSLAFGPVLVEDYKVHDAGDWYQLGEVTEHYSRSSLGQRGSCHYLLMTINPGYGTGSATIEDSRNIMQAMGVERAYAMDGGQTAEIVIQNRMFNPVDFLNERMVSDIIYFATALPESENR